MVPKSMPMTIRGASVGTMAIVGFVLRGALLQYSSGTIRIVLADRSYQVLREEKNSCSKEFSSDVKTLPEY